MVESNSLENCQRNSPFGGSNPPLSVSYKALIKNLVKLITLLGSLGLSCLTHPAPLQAYFEESTQLYTGDLAPFELLEWRLLTFDETSVDKPTQTHAQLVLFLQHHEKDKAYSYLELEVFFEEKETQRALGSHCFECRLNGNWTAKKKKKLVLHLKEWQNPRLSQELASLRTKDLNLHFCLKNLRQKELKGKKP